jgi:thiol-disulfide isomerase/thioredoxin
MNKRFLTSLLVLAFLLAGCEDKEGLTKVEKSQSQVQAMHYVLQDPRGENITVTQGDTIDFGHDKEYTLVVFWATWCAPCRAEIPHLINIQNSYDNVKVVASLVEQDKPNQELLEFMEEYSMNYFVSNAKDEYAFSKMIAKKIGLSEVRTIPTMALFRNGEYVSHWIGPAPEEMITAKIESPKGE